MIIIGIAGGSESGKSTLTEQLLQEYHDANVLYHDNYYRHRPELDPAQRARLNFDHPDALETELLISHLRELRRGNAVRSPVYDFTCHLRSDRELTITPGRLLIVEGILLFHWKELRELLDWRIFVDVDADIRLLRRILRDTVQRGRSLEGIAEQYIASVRPMHLQFVEPTKQYADLLVKDCKNPVEWRTITSSVEMLLASENSAH